MGSAEGKFKSTSIMRNLLLEDSRITDMVKDQVYPLIAPKDTKGDFIIYKRDEYMREYNKMSITSQKCRVYFNVISDKYIRSQELAFLIDDRLSGYWKEYDLEIKLVDSTEDYEDGKYIQILLFEIE